MCSRGVSGSVESGPHLVLLWADEVSPRGTTYTRAGGAGQEKKTKYSKVSISVKGNSTGAAMQGAHTRF